MPGLTASVLAVPRSKGRLTFRVGSPMSMTEMTGRALEEVIQSERCDAILRLPAIRFGAMGGPSKKSI